MMRANERARADVQRLQRELAQEKLSHIESILEYRYGITATMGFESQIKRFDIFIRDHDGEIQLRYSYETHEVLKLNVESEASNLANRVLTHT